MTICHKGKHTIRVSVHAWPAHKRHGDTIGLCAEAKKKHAKAGAAAKGKSGDEHGKKAEHGGKPAAGPASDHQR